METIYGTKRLSNGQAMLLRLFERDLPEENLLEIKNILSRYLFEKAQQEADKLIDEGKVTLEDIEEASKEIAEHRGNYLKKIRNEGSN